MNNRDWTLLAVRVLGLYLLALAIAAIPHLVTLTFMLSRDIVTLFPEDIDIKEAAGKLRKEYDMQFVAAAARLLIYSGLGLYFLRSRSVMRRLGIPEANEPLPNS